MSSHLLIVEDQRAVARTLARALEMRGYTVSVAFSCAEALRRNDFAECAILDIDLPDGSGIDLCPKLLSAGRTTSVVFFSGSADGEIRDQARARGRLVAKSAGINELTRNIEAAIAEATELTITSATEQAS